MKTRIVDLPSGFTFQYGEGKRPAEWFFVGGSEAKTWPTAAQRDRARACFTSRRSVAAAIADLKKARLL